MKCPSCLKGEILIKEIYRQGKKFLIEYCDKCDYKDEIYLHKEII